MEGLRTRCLVDATLVVHIATQTEYHTFVVCKPTVPIYLPANHEWFDEVPTCLWCVAGARRK